MITWLALLVACGVLLAVAGCRGRGVLDDEMPAAPIAISFRTQEEARRRADALGERTPRAAASATSNELVPHTDDLRSVLGDVLVLKDGRTLDEGLVVTVTDEQTKKQTIYVCSAHYKVSGDAAGTMVRLGNEELKFTPDQVQAESIEKGKGKGKKLIVPISEGMRRYVDAYRSKHGN